MRLSAARLYAVEGTLGEVCGAFRAAFFMLDRRISILLCLPLTSLDTLRYRKNSIPSGTNEGDAPTAFRRKVSQLGVLLMAMSARALPVPRLLTTPGDECARFSKRIHSTCRAGNLCFPA